MEVNGKDFLRNVEIEKDKAKLAEQQRLLDEQKRVSLKQSPDYFESDNMNDNSAYVDLSSDRNIEEEVENNLYDIKLNNESNNKNKKKYIILGVALILLFIITIVVIRVISNSEQEEQLEPETSFTQTLNKDKILDKIDSMEEYQSVIDEKAKPIEKIIEKKDIILPETKKENAPLIIEKPKEKPVIRRDLFEMESSKIEPTKVKPVVTKKVETVKPKVEKKVVKRVQDKPKRTIVVPPANVTNFTKKSTNGVKGYYIQIGAFTKKPSDKLLRSISKKGYSYTVHSMVIKGRTYNKVLIGSYPSKNTAKKSINRVKKDFNNPNAYILKF